MTSFSREFVRDLLEQYDHMIQAADSFEQYAGDHSAVKSAARLLASFIETMEKAVPADQIDSRLFPLNYNERLQFIKDNKNIRLTAVQIDEMFNELRRKCAVHFLKYE